MAQTTKKKNWQYDFLRVLGMLLVMLFHYTTQYSKSVQETSFAVFFPQEASTFAVTLFFLMNGALAYRSLKDSTLSPLQYLKKRAVRLLPTFWLCLTITSLVLSLTGTAEISLKQYLLNAVLLNRVFNVPFVDGVYWYMLIVLIFTFFLAFAKCLRRPERTAGLFLLYGIAFLAFGVYNRFFGKFPELLSFAVFQYLNKCLVGVVFGWLLYEGQSLSRRHRIFGVLYIAALLLGEFLWFGKNKVLAEIAGFGVFAVVVLFGGKLRIGAKLERIIGSAAGESYYVYLIHQQVGFVIMKALISSGINCNAAILLTMAIIFLSAFLHSCLQTLRFGVFREKTSANK